MCYVTLINFICIPTVQRFCSLTFRGINVYLQVVLDDMRSILLKYIMSSIYIEMLLCLIGKLISEIYRYTLLSLIYCSK